jgi:cell cycle sensor histidine kinase DivJ
VNPFEHLPPRLLTRRQMLRQMGTGLGLSLVRAFARLHNGEMTMESSVGEGTSVTIRLPVLTQDAAVETPLRQRL